MLEFYFEHPTRLRQLRHGPLAEHLDGIAKEMRCKGYSRGCARGILGLIGRFNRFVRIAGVENAGDVDEALVERFLKVELASQGAFKGAPNAMHHLMTYLRRNGVIKTPDITTPTRPFADLLTRYNTHLRDVRGLALVTRKAYLNGACGLLTWFHKQHENRPLSEICGADILNYIMEATEQPNGQVWRRHLCSYTRIFLRYLHWEGITDIALDRIVPKMPYRRLSTIPRHLPWEQVRALIDGIDTSYPQGMRDKAILLLTATLGLRTGEVLRLQFNHISWRNAEIRLPQTKSSKERILPLPKEVGEAIADYALHGRPPHDSPYVFLRHRAPQTPLTSAGAICSIIIRRLKQVGIEAPSNGAHMLRHSLATRMINVGVPIGEIADILGHASIDTTAIYTKVDITSLAAVAMPFVGGGAK